MGVQISQIIVCLVLKVNCTLSAGVSDFHGVIYVIKKLLDIISSRVPWPLTLTQLKAFENCFCDRQHLHYHIIITTPTSSLSSSPLSSSSSPSPSSLSSLSHHHCHHHYHHYHIIIINNIFILIICSPKSELNALDGCLGDHCPVSTVLQLNLVKLLSKLFFTCLYRVRIKDRNQIINVDSPAPPRWS